MKEEKPEIRNGKISAKEGEIKVLIVDNGEDLKPGEKSIPNHDKITIIYPNIQR